MPHEVGQRHVAHPRSPADAVAPPGRVFMPAGFAIAGVDQPRSIRHRLDERAVETGMDPEHNQLAATAKHPRCLSEHAAQVLDIGGYPDGRDRVEALARERERLRVGANECRMPPTGDLELIE